MLLGLTILLASSASAQTRATELRVVGGWAGFIDDGAWVHHGAVGGSVRFYITNRLSIEPEFQYLKGSARHYDFLAAPYLSYDLKTSRNLYVNVFGEIGRAHV